MIPNKECERKVFELIKCIKRNCIDYAEKEKPCSECAFCNKTKKVCIFKIGASEWDLD